MFYLVLFKTAVNFIFQTQRYHGRDDGSILIIKFNRLNLLSVKAFFLLLAYKRVHTVCSR